jgi:hypothetical protein
VGNSTPRLPEPSAESRIKKLIFCLPTGRQVRLLIAFGLPELLLIAAQMLMFIPSAPLAQNHILCLHFLNLKQYCKDKFKKEQETE